MLSTSTPRERGALFPKTFIFHVSTTNHHHSRPSTQRTIQELGGLEKPDVVDMVPVPRPWEEPGAQRRRWWKKVKRWWGGQA